MRVCLFLAVLALSALAICDARNAISQKLLAKIAPNVPIAGSLFGYSSSGSHSGSSGHSSHLSGSSDSGHHHHHSSDSGSSMMMSFSSAGSSRSILTPPQAMGLHKAVIVNPSLTPDLLEDLKHMNEIFTSEPAAAGGEAPSPTDLNAPDNSDAAKAARKVAKDDNFLMGPDSCEKLPSERCPKKKHHHHHHGHHESSESSSELSSSGSSSHPSSSHSSHSSGSGSSSHHSSGSGSSSHHSSGSGSSSHSSSSASH